MCGEVKLDEEFSKKSREQSSQDAYIGGRVLRAQSYDIT